MPGKRRGPWFERESFGARGYWHRYWFAGRLMVYMMTGRP
jgi:hypothetical protein